MNPLGIIETIWLCLLAFGVIFGTFSIDTTGHNLIDKIMLYSIPVLILIWAFIATGLFLAKDNIII
jgi:hypothetical protein